MSKKSKTAIALAALLSPMATIAAVDGTTKANLNTKATGEIPYNITADVPVYFIGGDEGFNKIKGNLPELQKLNITEQAKLANKASAKIFVIDGNTKSVKGSTIQTLLAAGYPVIALNNSLSLRKSVNQLATQELKQKQAAHKVTPDIEAPVLPPMTAVTDSDGMVYHETLHGHYTGSHINESYTTIETDPQKALKLAKQWAINAIEANQKQSTIVTAKALHPVWELEYQRRFSSGDQWDPYGQLNINTMFYRLTGDGDDAFDWWTVEFYTEAIPGTVLYPRLIPYKTHKIENLIDANQINSAFHMTDYSPSQSEPSCSGSLDISMSSAGPDMGWSYSCNGEALYNWSSFASDVGHWQHYYDTILHTTSRFPITVKPGIQVRVPDGSSQPFLEFGEKNGIRFATGPGVHKDFLVAHDVALAWSYNGSGNLTSKGYTCTQVKEPSDPSNWHDNYICASQDIGLRFNNAGTISGMNCVRMHEPTDPHTWDDNYMCLPSDSDFELEFANSVSKKNNFVNEGWACVLTHEPSDSSWYDNYLCYRTHQHYND